MLKAVARYPEPIPGVNVRMGGGKGRLPKRTNCCTFVESVILGAAARSGVEVEWNEDLHKKAMIDGEVSKLAPPGAYVEAGLAHAPVDVTIPLGWCIAQGWRPRWAGGHTFMGYCTSADELDAPVLILDAGIDGIGFRMQGYERVIEKPDDWAALTNWTRRSLHTVYPFLAAARLRVVKVGDPSVM